MKINERLKSIANLVPEDAKVLDIGCDHALLDIYLVKEKKFKKLYASDINEQPLKQALSNIKKENVEKNIDILLGNGLDVYNDEIDTVIVAGLGGLTIKGIFKNNIKITKKLSTIIVSPNNYQIDIKKFLTKCGFKITDEVLVEEKNIIYQIIKFEKGKEKYDKRDYFFGPVLRRKKGELFKKYYMKEKISREILLNILPKNYRLKKYQLKKEIELIKSELE